MMIDKIISFLPVLGGILALIVGLLFIVAYLTYFERRVLAAMQLRRGPNVVGPFGLFQPIADGLKLLGKETIIPSCSDPVLFIGAPIFTFFLALSAWAVIPFDAGVVVSNLNVGLLYLFAISSFGVYGVIIAGWASGSRYPLLGALRAAAQMISYEVSIGFVLVCVLIQARSLNLSAIVEAQKDGWFAASLLFPMFIVFFISALAETNRHPFDLPEGESELVGGYNTEYSSIPFALFFLGDYANMVLMSALTTILFLGGWLAPFPAVDFLPHAVWFALKVAFCLFVFVWARATFPRYRYDQLMRIGWTVFLPLSLVWVIVIAGVRGFSEGWLG